MSAKGRHSTIKPIYAITGQDPSLVANCRQELIEILLEPEYRSTGLVSIEGSAASIEQVLDELRTVPLLGPRRLVVINNADRFLSANHALLEEYLERPSPTGVLIVTISNWDGRSNLAKRIASQGELVTAEPPKPWQMPTELARMATQKYRKHLSPTAANLLVELVGQDWARLCAELDKLALYVDNRDRIEPKDVEELTGQSRLYSAFDVISQASRGLIGQALQQLRQLFELDGSSPYTMIGAIAFHLRRLLQAKALLQSGSSKDEVVERLRIYWRQKDAFIAIVDRMSTARISQILQELGEIDYMIKTGQRRADVAIERLVLSLAGTMDEVV